MATGPTGPQGNPGKTSNSIGPIGPTGPGVTQASSMLVSTNQFGPTGSMAPISIAWSSLGPSSSMPAVTWSSSSPNDIVFLEPGWYETHWVVTMTGNVVRTFMTRNTLDVVYPTQTTTIMNSNYYQGPEGAALIDFAAGDTVQLNVQIVSGTSISVVSPSISIGTQPFTVPSACIMFKRATL